MAKLTRKDILKLADLARLELKNEEVEEFRNELTAILDYVEVLKNVDIKGLEPTNQVSGLVNVTRADKIYDYRYDNQELLKNVPRLKDNQIQTQRVIE